MNETNNLASGPDTELGVTVDEYLLSSLAADEMGNLAELARRALALNLEGLLGNLVLEKTAGVAPAAEQQGGICLLGLDNLVLDVLVNGSLHGAHEACAHVDTTGAEGQSSSETPAVGETTRGDERNLEGLASTAQQDEVGNVALADVAGAFETVNGEEVDTELDGALGMANGGALVEDGDAGLLQLRNDRPGRVSGSLDNLDAFVDDSLGVSAVVGRNHGGEESDVDTEGVLGQLAAALNLFAEGGGRGKDEGGYDTQTASVGDSRGQFGGTDVHHAALDDGHCWRVKLATSSFATGKVRVGVNIPRMPRRRVNSVAKGILAEV